MAFSHMASNKANKPIRVFEKVAEDSSPELLVGIYSSKRKILFWGFVDFVINTIVKPSNSTMSASLAC